ncbi:MAG TPA: hypothetical protein VGD05_06590 [Pyrinomonadaceae bacterium]|jgi:hypothetical protein
MPENNTQLEADQIYDKHRRSLKIYAVANELNRQIEDANNNGHPVYLELHVRNGHLRIEPIFFAHPKLATNEAKS